MIINGAFASTPAKRYTIMGWFRFSGTEEKLYSILTLSLLNKNNASDFPVTNAQLLRIIYNLNASDKFIAILMAVGSAEGEIDGRILEGDVVLENAWTFISVAVDYEKGRAKLFIKVFENKDLQNFQDITIDYGSFDMERDYTVFLGRDEEFGQEFVGKLYNFYVTNEFI